MKESVNLRNLIKGLKIIAEKQAHDLPVICKNELWIGDEVVLSNEDVQELNELGFSVDKRGFVKVRI